MPGAGAGRRGRPRGQRPLSHQGRARGRLLPDRLRQQGSGRHHAIHAGLDAVGAGGRPAVHLDQQRGPAQPRPGPVPRPDPQGPGVPRYRNAGRPPATPPTTASRTARNLACRASACASRPAAASIPAARPMPTAPTRCSCPCRRTAAPPPASPSKWRRPIRRATSPPAPRCRASRSRLGQRRRHAIHLRPRRRHPQLRARRSQRPGRPGLRRRARQPPQPRRQPGRHAGRGADLPARLHRRHPWQPAPEQQRRALAASGELDRCAVSRHQLQWTDRRRHGYADSIRTGLRSGRRPEPVPGAQAVHSRQCGHRPPQRRHAARGTDLRQRRAGAQRRLYARGPDHGGPIRRAGTGEGGAPHRPQLRAAALAAGDWASNNQARPGDWLQYRITYRNKNIDPLRNLVITDATPAFTRYVNATCGTSTPDGLACSPPSAGSNPHPRPRRAPPASCGGSSRTSPARRAAC